jgi:ABC-type antimicrobial peptide transport system permease subunit
MNDYLPISPTLLVLLALFLGLMLFLFVVGKVPITYNLRNIAVRWVTTVVIGLAFALVTAILTLMLAFVTGMDRLTEGSGIPGNVITLSDGANDEVQSSLSAEYSIDTLKQYSELDQLVVKDAKGRYLSSREVLVSVNQPVKNATPGGRARRFLQVRGLFDPDLAAQVHNIELYPKGRWFTDTGLQKGKADGKETTLYEVVVGEGVARDLGSDLGKPTLETGDIFEIGPIHAVVIGVMKSDFTTFGSEIWAKSGWVGERFNKLNTISSITTRTQNADTARAAVELVKKHKEGAATAMTETEYYSKLTATNDQFRIAIVFIAIIIAIGGAMGVMNTMYAAVSQRTKDIGVLRILGYSRKQVLMSFLLESMVVAAVGGLVGCGLGLLGDGASAASTLSSGFGGGGKSVVLRLVVDANVLAAGLVFTLIMGALGGLVPALSAMRLRPLESMR